jgi:hypothetical protein
MFTEATAKEPSKQFMKEIVSTIVAEEAMNS